MVGSGQGGDLSSTEAELKARTPQGRIFELDALRGLAAFTVIWHHFRSAFHAYPPHWYVAPLFAGHEAVVLFFVLSGYVLSIPVWRGRQPAYRIYLVRRIFRIYVPFLGALILAAFGAYFFMGSKLPLTSWFHETWTTPLSPRLIVAQLLMSTNPTLNTAFWSLRYEMEMSLIFPLLCAFILKTRLAGAAGLIAVAVTISELWRPHNASLTHLNSSIHYSTYFILGAILSLKREQLAAFFRRLSTPVKCIVGLLSGAAYFNYLSPDIFPRPMECDHLVALGAAGLIVVTQNTRLRNALDTPVPEYLGRVSYSMYLMHGTVLFTLLNLLYGRVSIPVLIPIYLISVMVVSHLFCIAIEEPAMAVGKLLTGGSRRPEVKKQENQSSAAA
jgi:peptidoglycan/LPS O-acetylase OafA/YrhL